ncbi:MAG: FadR family transcriptional regulator [Actinomycetaceae bacterium]|nr:FadR family transcriptional regulator [Actinomycetaceae bacterium]
MLSDKSVQALLDKYSVSAFSDRTDALLTGANRSAATMDAIKSYILDRGLKPGDPLPTEAKLCADLGVARSSVREALRKLEALDIVSVQQGRGSFVGNMTMRPLVETLILRNALDHSTGKATLRHVVATRRTLDLGIAEEVVNHFKNTHNPDIHALVDAMTQKAERGETYLDEDIAFHNALNSFSGNTLTQQLMSAMWLVHQAFLPHLDAPQAESLLITAKTHGDMIRAAEAGDLKAYKEAVNAHYGPLAKLIDLDT